MSLRLLTLPDLATELPRKGRLLGLDLGTKTIGLALSDVERRLASPLHTIRRVKFTRDAEQLLAAATKFDVQALILGLPLNMDGSEGPRAQATRAFLRNLAPLTTLPCCFWDERLSTAAVQRDLVANDVSRARRAAVIDQMAAAYILEGALARLNRLAAEARAARAVGSDMHAGAEQQPQDDEDQHDAADPEPPAAVIAGPMAVVPAAAEQQHEDDDDQQQ